MKKTIYSYSLLAILYCGISFAAAAQDGWRYRGQVNFGCNLFFMRGPGQNFPGLRVFAAFTATANRGDFLLSYGPSVSVYTKTIGANLNPLVGDWQMDFTNSFNIGLEWGKHLDYNKFSRTLHNGDFYNVITNRSGMLMLGTNFILNNHKRNQIVGSLNATIGKLSFNYYNDGPPFNFTGTGDGFDRYWTGGGAILYHSGKNYNYAEMAFDQFTGYIPLLYELTSLLGMNVPLYDAPDKNKVYNFNTSAYSLKLNFDQRFGINAGVVGSLKDSKRGRYWGIQELIHVLLGYPLHPNEDGNRFFIGGTYNQLHDVRF